MRYLRWLLLLIPVAVSGGLLVYHDEIDSLLNPKRYAVTGAEIAQPPSVYLARAAEAVAKEPGNLVPTGARYPEEPGWPIRVVTSPQQRGQGPIRFVRVFLDPPTGAVLDVMDFRSSFVGFMHIFHENLMIPQYSGRQIVGWVGVAMLILSLTGIWLWWPRNGAFLKGVRWKRAPQFTFNLHNMLGFWISIPLAVVSLTGIYLSFPQTARSMMSSIATMNPQGQRGFGAPVAQQTSVGSDRVAYQVFGQGPRDLVATAGQWGHLDLDCEDPGIARFHRRLASFGRLIRFDPRGTGLSDPRPGDGREVWQHWSEDLAATMDACGSQSAAILAWIDGGMLALQFAAALPDRVRALVLMNVAARYAAAPDYPEGSPPEAIDQFLEFTRRHYGTERWARASNPSLAGDERILRWYAK